MKFYSPLEHVKHFSHKRTEVIVEVTEMLERKHVAGFLFD
jgi:hypothetical protein